MKFRFSVIMNCKFLTLIISPLLLASPAFAQFEMLSESENQSQLTRSNVAHYWKWSKDNLKSYPDLAKFTSAQGIVSGDPHLGNFSIIPMINSEGTAELIYANADLDDAGTGSFAIDFARLVVASKAITNEVNIKDLTENYTLGLRGEERELPNELENIFNQYSISDYQTALDKYVSKRVKAGKFILETGKIEKYKGTLTKAEAKTLLPDFEILDLANRPQDRGGSKNSERIWILANDSQGDHIYELKLWQASKLSNWTPQKSIGPWLKEVTAVFDPHGSNENYRIIKLKDGRFFWLREKKFTLVDIPYSANKSDEIEMIQNLAAYAAFQLGRWHGQQPSAKAYVKSVIKDEKVFREALSSFVKDYIAVLKAALK